MTEEEKMKIAKDIGSGTGLAVVFFIKLLLSTAIMLFQLWLLSALGLLGFLYG
jgi:hypothetical protein